MVSFSEKGRFGAYTFWQSVGFFHYQSPFLSWQHTGHWKASKHFLQVDKTPLTKGIAPFYNMKWENDQFESTEIWVEKLEEEDLKSYFTNCKFLSKYATILSSQKLSFLVLNYLHSKQQPDTSTTDTHIAIPWPMLNFMNSERNGDIHKLCFYIISKDIL